MPHLSWTEVRDRAVHFSRDHAEDSSESAQKQTFWNEFFHVFGLRRASLAAFEANVINLKGNKGAIDLLWRGKLLVEHKSKGEDLDYAKSQAFTYIEDLTRANRWDEIPRYVLVSDFAHFVLYDLEPEEQKELALFAGRKVESHHFSLKDFPKHIRSFAFMLGQTRLRLKPEDPANQKAYDRMCELHDALKSGGFTGHDLERLLVRVLFCVFAEDTLIFPPEAFTQFIRTQTREDGSDCGARLNELFDWLNNARADDKLEDTDPFFGFRYVNGGLFHERLGFPRFTREMREKLLACCDFQWAKISPAVFGSLFQGVLDDKSRRQQGAHYTSERDIMKVLRSLFLDALHNEFSLLKHDRSNRRRANLEAFHQKLRSLNFLDPACGCGNFLVLGYRELRLLEMEVIRAIHGTEQQVLDVRHLLQVDVNQFHGIEYAEWPTRIAEVALWLMDHQMNVLAADSFGQSFDRLPLKSSPHIVQGNALREDWNKVLPREKCSYVMGNPPFIGKHYQSAEQRSDMVHVYGELANTGDLDYVTAWFFKAGEYIQGTLIGFSFVATNSITQGEQVPVLWSILFQRFHLKIHFAHRTFAWTSEARGKAHVHVVIIGLASFDVTQKFISDYDTDPEQPVVVEVANISPYLTPGSDSFVTKHRAPISNVPEMRCGNKPTDDGNFILTDAERVEFLRVEPDAKQYLRQFTGSEEFINGNMRWCLWLKDASPGELRKLPRVMERVERVREFRAKSTAKPTQKAAEKPTQFFYISQPETDYILIPEVSSERRSYIPIGFVKKEVISANTNFLIPSSDIFLFGVLTSAMHMAWVRTVGGRLKSDYRYSGSMVYNNFPWPTPTAEQRAKVEDKARAVLAVREKFQGSADTPVRIKESCGEATNKTEADVNKEADKSVRAPFNTLADLYDPLTMPPALAKAHAELDRAVERCYRSEPYQSDRERVEHLFRLYEQLTAPLLPAAPKTKGRRKKS